MSLLTPLALLGFFTLPIIFLLHLLATRRKPLLISSLRLWHGLQQKKQGVLPRHIPVSLMLILQLGVATALTLGLARPALSFLLHQPQHTIFILDTTTSMTAEDAGQTNRFDVARQTIAAHLQAMYDNDSVVVIGLNRHPEVLVTGDGQPDIQTLRVLDELRPGATGLDLSAALTLANGLINPERENQIIVLTDGNYPVNTDELPLMHLPVTWQFIPTEPGPANQALLNVSAHTWPDGRHRLFARVVNYSDTPVARTLQVLVDGLPAGETTIELNSQAETTRAWTLPNAAQTAAVEIVEPDALPLDNRAELLLAGAMQPQILLISDAPEPQDSALARAFAAQPGIEFTVADTSALNHLNLTEFDLVVFDGLPPSLTQWPEGNVLVVNPPLNHPLLPVEHAAYDVRPEAITASDLLTGIDWSGVYFGQASALALPNWAEPDLLSFPLTDENLVGQILDRQTVDRLPLIFHGPVSNSRVFVWAFDLAESNLAGRLALPLLTANTLSYLLSTSDAAVVALGNPALLDQNLSVETPDGRRLFLPSHLDEKSKFTQTNQPGLYKVYNENDRQVGGFAVHAGSALESNLTKRFQPETLVSSALSTMTTSPETEYYEFWPWLAGFALVIVTLEGWLAWRR